MPVANVAVAALWLAWAIAPPPISSIGSFGFDVYGMPAMVGCVFGVTVVGMVLGRTPRGLVGCIALAPLALILAAHAFAIWMFATWPSVD